MIFGGAIRIEFRGQDNAKTTIVPPPQQIGAGVVEAIGDRLERLRPARRVGRRVVDRLDCGDEELVHANYSYRSTSLVSSATSSLWRDTPVLENTRLSTVRAVSSVMPSFSAASRGGRPEPTRAAMRASPSVSPNTSRTSAGSAGPLASGSIAKTIARAWVRNCAAGCDYSAIGST